MEMESCFCVLLAGGLARRMGGGDKTLREAGGVSLLARVMAALAPQCLGLVLNANGDPARFAPYDVPVVADTLPGFQGPLAGILAGLDWISDHHPEVPLALSVPADMPFLPNDLARRLISARREHGTMIACARSGGRIHPPVALWPVAIKGELRHLLLSSQLRKVEAFSERFSRVIVDWPATPDDPFFNINEPGDLAAAEAILAMQARHIA